MALTDKTIRSLIPGSKAHRAFDEKGLYLEVSPAGGKLWRLKYRFNGKEKKLALGVYPDVSLKDARDSRDDARKMIVRGVDPSQHRRIEKLTALQSSQDSFEAIGREWFEKFKAGFAAGHVKRLLSRLENDVFPFVGASPISQLTPPEILAVVRRVESRTLDGAHRVMQTCGQIFRYAIATGRCASDPTRDLRGSLPPVEGGHFAATTNQRRLGQILTAIDGYQGTPVVHTAMRLAPMVFVRPGELRKAVWTEFDLDAALWEFVVSKQRKGKKVKETLIVPLATQAVSLLRDLFKITGHCKNVFPGARSKLRPMSENAVLYAMRSLEITKEEMTGHGFRAVARTFLDENLKFRPEYIEQQLSHKVKDPNGRAYNRTKHLDDRRVMMQAWADYLDTLKADCRSAPKN